METTIIENIENIELDWTSKACLEFIELLSSYLDFQLEIRVYFPTENDCNEFTYPWELTIIFENKTVFYCQYSYDQFGESELKCLKDLALESLKAQVLTLEMQ